MGSTTSTPKGLIMRAPGYGHVFTASAMIYRLESTKTVPLPIPCQSLYPWDQYWRDQSSWDFLQTQDNLNKRSFVPREHTDHNITIRRKAITIILPTVSEQCVNVSLFSPPFDQRTKLATVNYSRKNFNVINITISFDNLTKSQCFPKRVPQTLDTFTEVMWKSF